MLTKRPRAVNRPWLAVEQSTTVTNIVMLILAYCGTMRTWWWVGSLTKHPKKRPKAVATLLGAFLALNKRPNMVVWPQWLFIDVQ